MMKDKLPLWAVIGGFLLACAGGCMNGFVLIHNLKPASHLTGTTTSLGFSIARYDVPEIIHAVLLITFFVCGSAISGMIVRNYHFKLGRRYGVTLLLETVVIVIAMNILELHNYAGIYLVTFACGLQNAMVTTYSGAALRTTHVTGLFTDLGVQLGHALAGLHVEKKRVEIQLLLVIGFFLGGVFCGFAIGPLGRNVMLLPALITGLSGSVYFIYRISHYYRGKRIKPHELVLCKSIKKHLKAYFI